MSKITQEDRVLIIKAVKYINEQYDTDIENTGVWHPVLDSELDLTTIQVVDAFINHVNGNK